MEKQMTSDPHESTIPTASYMPPNDSQIHVIRHAIWRATMHSRTILTAFDLATLDKRRDFSELYEKLYAAVRDRYWPTVTIDVQEFNPFMTSNSLWETVAGNETLFLDVFIGAISACPTTQIASKYK
jgi:hypothetical protein